MSQGSGVTVLDDGMPKRAAVLEDIRIAEEQISRGEGVEHDAARAQVLGRLNRKQQY